MVVIKTVFITGASGGIGGAAALLFAKNGYNIALGCHQNTAAALALAEKLAADGTLCGVYPANLASSEEAAAAIAKAETELGFISVLVNAAGHSKAALLQDMPTKDIDAAIALNLTACLYACRAVLPAMVRRGAGSIVNISSIYGVSGGACEVAYSAAKAGLIGLTKALAKEVAPCGIRVNCVAPGVVATGMNAAHSEDTLAALAAETPLGRIGTPEEIAAAVYFLAADGASFITGQTLVADGGFTL